MNKCELLNLTIQRLATGGATPILPPEYQQVEYLQSSSSNGNGYSIHIDTGITYFADFEIVCKRVDNDATKFCGVAQVTCLQRESASNPYYRFDNTYGSGWMSDVRITTKAKLRWKNDEIYIDDVFQKSFVKATSTIGHFMLYGAQSSGGGGYYNNIQIYSFKAWDTDGALIRDMYPCYRIADSVKGFYDTVNDVFYTGTGNGSFIAGADV